MSLSKRYEKCPDCGKYAVHLAMREVTEFSGDQDDNLGETSVYDSEYLELKHGVSLFVHACFECDYLENVGIEWPREKVIDTRAYQWTPEWPTEPGDYWFCGWAFLHKAKAVDKPETILVKAHRGRNSVVLVGNGGIMYDGECIGLWSPANLPEPPEDQLKEML